MISMNDTNKVQDLKSIPDVEIEKRFSYHPPTEAQPQKYEEIRGMGKAFAELINELCPDSMDKREAIKKIEEAVFWANASIARYS